MLKRSQLEQWFPDEKILTVPDSALPQEISDPLTRQVLTEIGLPMAVGDAVELDIDSPKGIRKVGEVYREYDEAPPEGVDDLYYLGFVGRGFLTVDGRTGLVFQVHRNTGARILAGNLEVFISVLGLISCKIDEFQQGGESNPDCFVSRLCDETLAYLKQIEAASASEAGPTWRELIVANCEF